VIYAVVALGASTGAVGAPGDDSFGANAGAAFVVDVGLQRAFFASAEYVGAEGEDAPIVVALGRDPAHLSRALTVASDRGMNATSDVTARGVDTLRFAECMAAPVAARRAAGCGDYLQVAGEATFAEGRATTSFIVFLVNDACASSHARLVRWRCAHRHTHTDKQYGPRFA
jgi:hypothetical protein